MGEQPAQWRGNVWRSWPKAWIRWIGFMAVCGAIGGAPLVGAMAASAEIRFSASEWGRIWGTGSESWSKFLETASLALGAAAIATMAGTLLVWLSTGVNETEMKVWMFAHLLGLLTSPYVIAQGWIGLLGERGLVFELVSWDQPSLTIYSSAGVVGLQALYWLPLALVCIWLSWRNRSMAQEELARLLGWDAVRRFWHIDGPAMAPGCGMAFGMVAILAFWSYEIPSMLRHSTFPLEVMAAFGSFYDYGAALTLALPPLLISLGVATLCAATISTSLAKPCTRSGSVGNADSTAVARILMGLLLVFGLGVPLVSLVVQAGGDVWIYAGEAWPEIRTTVSVGLCAALGATLLALGTVLTAHLAGRRPARCVIIVALASLGIPGALAGIGFVHFFSVLPGWFPGSLVWVQAAAALPWGVLAASIILLHWPPAWSEVLRLSGHGLKAGSLVVWRHYSSVLGVVAFVTFAVATREVPASLLNYPPDGATLALSIETMLHFEQAGRIATYALIQTTLGLGAGLIAWRSTRWMG